MNKIKIVFLVNILFIFLSDFVKLQSYGKHANYTGETYIDFLHYQITVDCPPFHINYGKVSPKEGFPDIEVVECNEFYNLFGAKELVCNKSHGVWDQHLPYCIDIRKSKIPK